MAEEYDEQWTPAQLRALELPDQDEAEIVARIRELLRSPDSKGRRAELIYVLDVALPWLAIGPLLELLHDQLGELDDEEVRQLAFALDRALDVCTSQDDRRQARAGE